jgi:hypothetical protein
MRNSNKLNQVLENTSKAFDYMIENNDVLLKGFNQLLNSDKNLKAEFFAMSKEDQVKNYKMIAMTIAHQIGFKMAFEK